VGASKEEGYSLATLHTFVGHELGVSDWLTVDQERINAFAACTGDFQWIHVDVERAKRESPFGSTIAHGYLTLSLLPQWQYAVGLISEDAVQALNYGLDRVRFITPVKAGARLRNRVVLLDVQDKGNGRVIITTRNTVEIEEVESPAMVADTVAALIGAHEAKDKNREHVSGSSS
jgi:VCBS repeat-containing protein